MCNLSQGVEERGIEKGLTRGRQEERSELVKKLLASGMSAEKLASILDLPQKDIEKLK